jgi:5-methylcytosine-specific restriction enzyme B
VDVNFEELETIWDDFLAKWPLEKLENITLEEYSQIGDSDCFTVGWLEIKTQSLGSIWGGSSFKFGVYSRRDKSNVEDGSGKSYAENYAWYTKYGNTVEEAFNNVRAIVVKVATAARAGDLSVIEQADLGPAVKWKIAFLYQNRDNPILINAYKIDNLQAVAGDEDRSLTHEQLYKIIMAKRGDEPLLKYGYKVWEESERILNLRSESEKLTLTKDQFLEALSSEDVLYEGDIQMLQTWLAMPNKETTAPKLAESLGYSSYSVANSKLGNLAKRICKALSLKYKGQNKDQTFWVELLADFKQEPNNLVWIMKKELFMALNEMTEILPGTQVHQHKNNLSLNLILYGPPGTGKTYLTIVEALKILDPEFLQENETDRSALKSRFDALVVAGHIRFVTFHQSFSYEDFVEGLRAESTDDGRLEYPVVDGVFKSLCEAASAKLTQQAEAPIDLHGRKIWKMSLGNSLGSDAYIFDDCIENNYALHGYGNTINFVDCKDRNQIYNRFIESGEEVTKESYAVSAVSTFVLKMKPGDLLVVTEGNSKFRAIGEVTGDYKVIEREDGDNYCQCRDVKWLRVYKPSLPISQLMHNQFSQMTLYELRDGSINMDALSELLHQQTGTGQVSKASAFTVGESFGRGYIIKKVSKDIVELEKPNGNTLPLEMSLLNTLADNVLSGQITIDDIRKNEVFTKIPDSKLEPYIVNGYENILALLIEKVVAQRSSSVPSNIQQPRQAKVLIIDEINRGNISRIFGELITLIEPSKRAGSDEALEVVLPYSKKPFTVPSNLYLIGTMNTADRSLAGMDIALRRRFTFKEIPPMPELLDEIIIQGVNIGSILRQMNERIEVLLDRDHCLGHAYFIGLKDSGSLEDLALIFRQQIFPLLEEYFFEDWERISLVLNDKRKVDELKFIQEVKTDLSVLFDIDTANNLQESNRRWRINEKAFENIESYRGILGDAA